MVLLLWHIDLTGRSIVVYYKGKKKLQLPPVSIPSMFLVLILLVTGADNE